MNVFDVREIEVEGFVVAHEITEVHDAFRMVFVELLDEVFGDLSFSMFISRTFSVNDRKVFFFRHSTEIPFVAVDEVALAIGVFEIRGIERGLLCGHVGVFSAADEGVFAFGQSALQDVNSASRMTVAVDGDSAVGKC